MRIKAGPEGALKVADAEMRQSSKQAVVLRRTSGGGDGAVEKLDDVQNFLTGLVQFGARTKL